MLMYIDVFKKINNGGYGKFVNSCKGAVLSLCKLVVSCLKRKLKAGICSRSKTRLESCLPVSLVDPVLN